MKNYRQKSVLYPNGVANSGVSKSGTDDAPAANNSSTPGNRTPTTPARTGTPLGTNSNPSNLANRPSPFVKRSLAGLGLLGGVVSGSNSSLGSTRPGSPAGFDVSGKGTPSTEIGGVVDGGGEGQTRTPMSEPAPSASLSGTGTGPQVEGTALSATISIGNGGLGPTSEA